MLALMWLWFNNSSGKNLCDASFSEHADSHKATASLYHKMHKFLNIKMIKSKFSVYRRK